MLSLYRSPVIKTPQVLYKPSATNCISVNLYFFVYSLSVVTSLLAPFPAIYLPFTTLRGKKNPGSAAPNPDYLMN